MNFKMNDKNKAPFKVEDVNWDELSGIGILKDELEQAGELETLLRGEKTGVVSLSLVLLGVDVVMDATLQLAQIKQASAKLIKMTEESTLWIIKI